MRAVATLLFLFLPLTLWVQTSAESGQKPKEPDKKTQPDHKTQAELKWAKGLVEDFFATGRGGDYQQTVLLMTDELKKAMVKPFSEAAEIIQLRFQDKIKSWTILVEGMAPDGNEAFFKGFFSGPHGEADFVVRVVKEKESSKWRINLFTMSDWKKDKKEVSPNPNKGGGSRNP